MLLSKNDSCFLLIDVQKKLLPKILNHEQLLVNCRWLIEVAKRLEVPALVSEQYPKGLGSTVDPLRELVSTQQIMEKMYFSCVGNDQCWQRIAELNRQQIVIAGIETHVCVMQTAIELQSRGRQVYAVVDAISSRTKLDSEIGLERMREAGVHLVTKEMVLFEWLRHAGTPLFKEMSNEFLK